MRILSLLALLAVGCAPPPPPGTIYTTRCGMNYRGLIGTHEPAPRWSETIIQDLEDRAVETFASDANGAKMNQHEICESLEGYSLFIHAEPKWDCGPKGECVAGRSFCLERRVEVATPIEAYSLRYSSLIHEIAHLVQDCKAPLPIDPGLDEAHADWDRDGIYDAIDKAQEFHP